MKSTYLVVINIFEFDSHQKDRFYELLSSFFPWSIQLFENVIAIQTDEGEQRIANVVYECAERMKEGKQVNEKLLGGNDSRSLHTVFQIEDLVICELGDHLAHLKDTEKTKHLEKMLSRERQ